MASKEEYNTGLMRFLEEITADTTTGTASEKFAQLTAYSKVRSVLSQLKLPGVRIFEGTSFLDRYEISLAKEEREVAELDFIIRMENVELQLEVKPKTSEGPYLTKEDFLRYRSVLERSAKTEEILVVWVNDDFPTLVMNLSTIQKYLSELQGERQAINSQLLKPLVDAIESTFARLMNVWIEPEEISITKEPYYDVQKLFGDSLRTKIENLKATSERRRLPDKKIAIESIVDSDIALLEQIFGEGRAEELSIEKVETKLKKMWGLGQE